MAERKVVTVQVKSEVTVDTEFARIMWPSLFKPDGTIDDKRVPAPLYLNVSGRRQGEDKSNPTRS